MSLDPLTNFIHVEVSFRSFHSTEDVLKGARHMVAMQIAHEPLVRQVIRDQLKERAKLTCRPTKKGLKVRHNVMHFRDRILNANNSCAKFARQQCTVVIFISANR